MLQTEVWVMAYLDADSEARIRAFLKARDDVVGRRVRKDMHLTVYHARRPLRGLHPLERPISVQIPLSAQLAAQYKPACSRVGLCRVKGYPE